MFSLLELERGKVSTTNDGYIIGHTMVDATSKGCYSSDSNDRLRDVAELQRKEMYRWMMDEGHATLAQHDA